MTNNTSRALRLAFLGLRGFPDVQGGVETHCSHLCPMLAEMGFDVTVIARSGYFHSEYADGWRGVKFKSIWAPNLRSAEALVHSLLGVLYAAWARPDVLHIHAIGPAFWAPLARCLGLRVVVTHHGPDYDRQKWGKAAKSMLKLGELLGMRWANARIVISQTIKGLVLGKYGLDSVVIPNGVDVSPAPSGKCSLDELGLEAGKYILMVSRLVPEKRHLDLIEAFQRAQILGWKLVLVGASDHPDEYAQSVLRAAAATPGVVLAGFRTGDALAELYAYAGMFVLPSSHEGLPIALLEALSAGLPVLASDIPANLEVGLPDGCYFPLGNIDALAVSIDHIARSARTNAWSDYARGLMKEKYDWRVIAAQTGGLYKRVVFGA